MKIPFAKLNQRAYPFKLEFENMAFEGKISKHKATLAELVMSMKGFVFRPCDSCGKEFKLDIDEALKLFLSDGIFKDKENKLSDTLEFFNAEIDLDELVRLELENYLSDYFYCENCENKTT